MTPAMGHQLEGLFALIRDSAYTNHGATFAKRSSTASATSGGDYVTEVLEFISSRPPNTNIYAALATWLNMKSTNINPLWLSILTLFFFVAHVAILAGSVSIIVLYFKMKEGWLIRRRPNGLFMPNRTFIEAIGGASYASVSLIHMLYQYYSDITHTPARGKVLTLWGRFPVVFFCLWCVTWGCITSHIVAIWNPTCAEENRNGAGSMPKPVVILLNAIFILFAVIFLIASILPTFFLLEDIFREVSKAVAELSSLSRAPDAMHFSVVKFAVVFKPLTSLPDRIDRVANSLKKAFCFLEALDVIMIITYSLFAFLLYRQNQSFRKSQSAVQRFRAAEKSIKAQHHQTELKTLMLEAMTLLIVLNTYTPIFIWAMTTRSSHELVLSSETAIVPEMTVGLVACFVGIIVVVKRNATTRRLLAIKSQKVEPQTKLHAESLVNQEEGVQIIPHLKFDSPMTLHIQVSGEMPQDWQGKPLGRISEET